MQLDYLALTLVPSWSVSRSVLISNLRDYKCRDCSAIEIDVASALLLNVLLQDNALLVGPTVHVLFVVSHQSNILPIMVAEVLRAVMVALRGHGCVARGGGEDAISELTAATSGWRPYRCLCLDNTTLCSR